MRNVVPSPGRLSQVIRPPWAATISRTMASPRPVPGPAALAGHAEELVEDVRQVLRRDADAGVGDRQRHRPSPAAAADSVIRPPAVGVGEGVVEQVAQGMAEPRGVDRDRRQVVGGLDGDRRRPCPRRGAGRRRPRAAAAPPAARVDGRAARALAPAGPGRAGARSWPAAARRCRGRRAAARSAWASAGRPPPPAAGAPPAGRWSAASSARG